MPVLQQLCSSSPAIDDWVSALVRKLCGQRKPRYVRMCVSAQVQNASEQKKPHRQQQSHKSLCYALHPIPSPTRPTVSLAFTPAYSYSQRFPPASSHPSPRNSPALTATAPPRQDRRCTSSAHPAAAGAAQLARAPLVAPPITTLIERARLIGALVARSGIAAGKGWTSRE